MLKKLTTFVRQMFLCSHANSTSVVDEDVFSYRYSDAYLDQMERIVLKTQTCGDCGLVRRSWVTSSTPSFAGPKVSK